MQVERGYRNRIYDAYVTSGAAGIVDNQATTIRARLPYLRSVIRQHFPLSKTSRVFDVGCGYGSFLYVAKQEGYTNLHGVDVSAQQVDRARQLGLEGVVQGDLVDHLKHVENSSVDVLITFDVLEHFTKDELFAIVEEAFRVIAPEGRWLIHVPNGESPFFGRIRYGDLTHELSFTAESLAVLLNIIGFERISCFEDSPAIHGVKSCIRFLLWKMIRTALRCYMIAETGHAGGVFTQNLLCLARKGPQRVASVG